MQNQIALLDSPGLYLTGEDNLRLTTIGGLAGAVVALEGRMVGPTGVVMPIAEQQAPNSNYTAKQSAIIIPEGVLTHLHVRVATGTAVRGLVYAIVEVIRGQSVNGQPVGTLLAGYISTTGRLAWPGSPIEAPTSGAGRLRAILGTDPAVNTEILETVPTGVRWRLRMFSFQLVASAAAANRLPVLTVDDGANVLWETASNVAQTANQTAKYRAGVGVPLATIGALTYELPLPADLVLGAGSRIRTVTGAIDAADNYGAPVYSVEEWIDG